MNLKIYCLVLMSQDTIVYDDNGIWRVTSDRRGFNVNGVNVFPIKWYKEERLSPSLRESYEEFMDSESSEYNSLKNSGIFRERLVRSTDEEDALTQARLTACACALNVLTDE